MGVNLMKRVILFLLFVCSAASAQTPARSLRWGTSTPSSCTHPSQVFINTTTPALLRCINNKFQPDSVGGVNGQTGTSYTLVYGDKNKLITSNNASAVAWSLPQATGNFKNGWTIFVFNLGAGTVTVTPTTSTINGNPSIAFAQNEGGMIFSDGTNYSALKTNASGAPTGAAGGSLDGSYPNPGMAAGVAGNGLAESSDVLSVNVDGSTIEINSDALRVKDAGITYAKIQNVSAASKLLGRGDSGSGAPQEITIGSGLAMTGTTLSATATTPAALKAWLPGAGCNNATAASFWDLPTSTPAVAACVTGSNTQKGVLDYADASGGFSAQNGVLLPSDWSGTLNAKILWTTSATSGNVKWSLSTICTATNASETDDPSFNTASTVTTAAPGTANRIQTSSISSVTVTGCAAGELLHLKLFRDGNDGSDTIGATARLIGVEIRDN